MIHGTALQRVSWRQAVLRSSKVEKGSRRRLKQDRNASEQQAAGKVTLWHSYI